MMEASTISFPGNPHLWSRALRQIPANAETRPISHWRVILCYLLLTLVGFNLRSVILGVPPVLPLVQHDLALSYFEVGLLTALPPLTLGASAWSLGLVIERLGEWTCVALGLLLLGLGAILRACWPSSVTLFGFTLLLCLGIVLAQTAVPSLARHWFPHQVGLVTALFSDGLIIGEALAAGLTVPLMQRFFGPGNWRASFIFWGVPALVLLLGWLALAPSTPLNWRRKPDQAPQPRAVRPSGQERRTAAEKKEAGRRVNAWHLGILLGGGSLIYFGMNAWIASYNAALQRAALTPLALGVLNTAQLPSSLLVTLFAQRLAGRRWPFIGAGLVCALSLIAWLISPPELEAVWVALIGAGSALVFTLGVALPALLAAPGEVARLTGMTLSLTYAVAFVGPLIGGALWDLFKLPALAFLPVLIACLLLIVLGALLPERPPRAEASIVTASSRIDLAGHSADQEQSAPPAAS
ncbi:CynX/NimT family MFS transporter [Thermogemmatispora sp.]|uniref:MFS transporter n=1 Tax=Thermogemmatispora sp. TaxID=1968838 RepID=UPI001D4EA465|nr:MFS transporter [Thermogemmatispora sp.]MBX5450195.1 MFS transporter [Thermogemmatispora sp.]